MLALILKRFHFELVPGQKHVPDFAVTIRSVILHFITPCYSHHFNMFLDLSMACGCEFHHDANKFCQLQRCHIIQIHFY